MGPSHGDVTHLSTHLLTDLREAVNISTSMVVDREGSLTGKESAEVVKKYESLRKYLQ